MSNNKRRKSSFSLGAFLSKYLIYGVVFCVVAVGVVSTIKIYKQDKEKQEKVDKETVAMEPGTEYSLAMFEPVNFNVLSSSDQDIVYINQLIYSFLFRLDNELNITPDLVESYTVNTDEGYVDITLRNDVLYSNGINVDAADIESTVNHIKEIGGISPYYQYASKIREVYVYGIYSLIIYFADPANAALDNLVFPIVSTSDYNQGQSFAVGSGQYAYSDYDSGKSLTLVPNVNYYGKVAEYPVNIIMVQNKDAIPGFITMDAVTAYLFKEPGGDTIASDKNLKCIDITSGELEYMGFNHGNKYLSDVRMRKAIAHAISRSDIIRDDYGGGGVASDSLYFPGFLGSDKEDTIQYEPKIATDYLSAMGLKDVDEDGILEDGDGNDVILTLIVNNGNRSRVDAARSISENLNSVGIDVRLEIMSTGSYNQAIQSKNFDLYLGGISIDKQFDLRVLYGTGNYGGYSGERIIELTSELERAHDSSELKTIFRELKSQLNDEIPYFGICYKKYYFMGVSTLEIGDSPQFFNPYRNLGTWMWRKKVL